VDDLAEAYWENLKDQFQDGLELSDEFRWEWVSIPHIYHTPFYVYAYSFGQLLVFSLYQQYRLDRDTFKPRYLKILSAGGSVSPGNLLADAGMDIATPEFWRGGFEVVEGLIKQLEEL
jgi:oligoendopeptidase F